MKLFKYLFLLIVGLTMVSCATKMPPKKPEMAKNIVVRTTAYSHGEKDHLKYGKLAATGTRLKGGTIRSAAADWSVFPVGTVFKIKKYPKYTFVVDDYGSALVGTKTIDLYQPTMAGIKKWGVRNVEIEILRQGCLETSRNILINRTKWPHVRQMVAEIDSKRANS